MLDSDSAIVSCETIMQMKEGVTIRRPLYEYRGRVAVWHLVINSRTSRNFSYHIIGDELLLNFGAKFQR